MLGLTEMGQPRLGSVAYSKELDTFSVKFYQSEEEEMVFFLDRFLYLLEEEIRFKTVLKGVISQQNRAERENQLLQRRLFLGA